MANRNPVLVDFWPFPAALNIPLFGLVLVALMIGVVWGGLAAWLAAGRTRKRARALKRRADIADMEIRQLEEQNSRLQQDLAAAKVGPETNADTIKALAAPANAA